MFNNICAPALVFMVFQLTHVIIDGYRLKYKSALLNFTILLIVTALLQLLCQADLAIISWFIVFIPFLLMTLVVAILLLMFGLDPATGKIKRNDLQMLVKEKDL